MKYQLGSDATIYEQGRDTKDMFTTLEVSDAFKYQVKECLVSNTDVRIETDDDNCKYEPHGQPLEVGLIKFLLDNNEDVQNLFIHRNMSCPVQI